MIYPMTIACRSSLALSDDEVFSRLSQAAKRNQRFGKTDVLGVSWFICKCRCLLYGKCIQSSGFRRFGGVVGQRLRQEWMRRPHNPSFLVESI